MNRNDQGMDRMHAVNGKRTPLPPRSRDVTAVTSSQHDDLIRYIWDWCGISCKSNQMKAWNNVCRDLQNVQGNNGSVSYYHEPNFQLKDFEPFDLEAWWGRRLVQNITQHS